MKILLWLIASCICGIIYRLGGIGKPFSTKYRDLGCSFITLIFLWILVGFKLSLWWVYLLFFLLTFGALTTYYDWLFKKDNFYFHGLGIGLASLPLIWCGIFWLNILVRCIALSILMGLWSDKITNDTLEEGGRGFLIIATMPLLLLPYMI